MLQPEFVKELEGSRASLERWRSGRIVVVNGRLDSIEKRWWGYRASWLRVWWDKRVRASHVQRVRARSREINHPTNDGSAYSGSASPSPHNNNADRCELYYHHALASSDFLVLGYIKSSPLANLSTFYVATLALDEIARIKRSNAIVAEIHNDRISDRLLARWGWNRHCPALRGRHFIKRFYGVYPGLPAAWQYALKS